MLTRRPRSTQTGDRSLPKLTTGLLLALTIAACEPAKIDLDVRGRVFDAATGEPLEGVSMALLWTTGAYDVQALGTASGSDGRYRLFVLQFPCDAVTLTAALDPYRAETKDVRCTEAEQFIDFELTR